MTKKNAVKVQDPKGFTTPKGRDIWIDDHENHILGVRFGGKNVPDDAPPVKIKDTSDFTFHSLGVEAWDVLLDLVQQVYNEGFNAGHREGREQVRQGIERILGVKLERD